MKVLITGASGYIGNRLAHQLAAENTQVVALIRSDAALPSLRHPNITPFIGDICKPECLASAIKGCRQVYHVAGLARLWAPDPSLFYAVNVEGTKNLLLAARNEQVEKLVYTSSTAVYGPSLREPITENDPRSVAFDSHYDLSKFLAEKEVLQYVSEGHQAVIVQPSRVYGSGIESPVNFISSLLLKALQGKIILLPGKPDVVGNYAYIEDVVKGHINAMAAGKTGEQYILGGENLSYRNITQVIEQSLGPIPVMHIPVPIAKQLARIYISIKKISGGEAHFNASGLVRYTRNTAFDCSKASAEIDYQITPFRIGIENTIRQILKTMPCHPQYSLL